MDIIIVINLILFCWNIEIYEDSWCCGILRNIRLGYLFLWGGFLDCFAMW